MRFAWRIRQVADGLRVEVVETPGGKALPLAVLPGPRDEGWPQVPPGEQGAIQALRAWSREGRGTPFGVLAALAGHPRLFFMAAQDQAGRPVLLQKVSIPLVVQREPGGFRVGFSLGWPEGPARLLMEPGLLTLEAPSALARALHPLLGGGLKVPAAGEGRLARLLGRWAPQVPLLTDVAPSPSPGEARAASRILVHLAQSPAGLQVKARVRPAPGAPGLVPGQGPAWMVGGAGEGRRLHLRDLRLEAGRLQRLEGMLPPDTRPGREAASWLIPDRPTQRGFLSRLGAAGSGFQLEGHPSQQPALPRPLDAGDLALEIRRGRRGWDVSGSVAGHPLGTVLAVLAKGGRFAELPDGRVLDLSEGLGLGLRALAGWGGAKEASGVPTAGLLGLVNQPGVRGDGAWGTQSTRLDGPPAELPAGFQGSLRPYQMTGFQWMARLLDAGLGACLADDMGLGKTVQTAALLAHRASLGPVLVVAPTSVAPNWAAELSRFTPGLVLSKAGVEARPGPGQVVLCSYGELLQKEALADIPWGTVVLDEAHAIKNVATQRHQATLRLQAAGRLALTGTPVENRPEELAALMGWVMPELAGRLAAATDLETLRALAGPFLLRRLKKEVLPDLPPRLDQVVWVAPGEEEATFQQELLVRCRAEAASGSAVHILAALTRLRMACSHPALVDDTWQGEGGKLEALVARLTILREEGHAALVFSQFTGMLDRVRIRLESEGFRLQHLDGQTPPELRKRRVDAFQAGEGDVFLISLRAGGTGLNLTRASHVFHLDPWWNPAVEDQASDRAHRIGQTSAVQVHRMVLVGSIEERVLALHQRKRHLVEALLDTEIGTPRLDRDLLLSLIEDGP